MSEICFKILQPNNNTNSNYNKKKMCVCVCERGTERKSVDRETHTIRNRPTKKHTERKVSANKNKKLIIVKAG